MPDTYNDPAKIERDEDGRYVVNLPDFDWGATDGATLVEALGEGRDLLRELMAPTMRESKRLPERSRGDQQRDMVVPPVAIALKAALYKTFREAGMSQRRLAPGGTPGSARRAIAPHRARHRRAAAVRLRPMWRQSSNTRCRGALIHDDRSAAAID